MCHHGKNFSLKKIKILDLSMIKMLVVAAVMEVNRVDHQEGKAVMEVNRVDHQEGKAVTEVKVVVHSLASVEEPQPQKALAPSWISSLEEAVEVQVAQVEALVAHPNNKVTLADPTSTGKDLLHITKAAVAAPLFQVVTQKSQGPVEPFSTMDTSTSQ